MSSDIPTNGAPTGAPIAAPLAAPLRDESLGPPPVPVPAATVMVVRDGPDGLEVFMVVRHHQIDFASGALVFPGGKVDPRDRDAALAGRVSGCAGMEAEAQALRVAAIRETFEECGLLLARRRGASGLLDAAALGPLAVTWREPLAANTIGMVEMAEREDLELACDLMVPFAHWITPPFMAKRFDTHFFLAAAPTDQLAAHDGGESVDSVWITPSQALADADAGRRTVIFPTRLNLQKLGRSASVAEALERARAEPVVTVLPGMRKTESGRVMTIPVEAGYGGPDFPVIAGA